MSCQHAWISRLMMRKLFFAKSTLNYFLSAKLELYSSKTIFISMNLEIPHTRIIFSVKNFIRIVN